MKHVSKLATLVFALVLAFALSACNSGAESSASPSEGSAEASASASESSAEATEGSAEAAEDSTGASAEATGELAGKPWVTSMLTGNLPAEQPEAKDDLYAHYNYEYLAAHQGQMASSMADHAGELQAAIAAMVKDESKTGHDLEQLRIFYNQAADAETLQAAGLSEVQPFLDRIDAVTTMDEMNALVTAADFPFEPFIMATVTTNDTRAKNIVKISPNFVLCDPLIMEGTYYQESDDPQVEQNMMVVLGSLAAYTVVDFMNIGLSQEEAEEVARQIVGFEKEHGKHLSAPGTYLNADYGAMAEATRESYFDLDEMLALAPNYPLKETLDKLGKGASETYYLEKDWLEAFNGLWTEENLDMLKLVAKAKVLAETRPYRDASTMNQFLEAEGQPVPDADTFAYSACSSLDTLANVVAKIYVDDVLGDNAKARLGTLAKDLVSAYKALVDETTWMGEESQARVIEKLDHMTLNVLEPAGGYLDYNGLDLTPTDQGGTLLSNYLKLKQYRYDCESKLINQPAVAASPWFGVAPTIANAFYDPETNSINVYPGYVTSLIYSDEMTDADLLGGAGWTIAHEISHGFDYTGSQLDAYGTPNPVYADADVDAFVLKSSTLASYYNGIEVMPGQPVNGQLQVGEATADLSGMQACLELASKTDGFDYNDYFEEISNVWAQVIVPEALAQYLVDTHPMNHLRVNVNVQMFDAIYDVLGVAEGDGMYLAPEKRIVIWGPKA